MKLADARALLGIPMVFGSRQRGGRASVQPVGEAVPKQYVGRAPGGSELSGGVGTEAEVRRGRNDIDRALSRKSGTADRPRRR